MRKKKSMRTGEAAEYLDVSKASITNWVRSGRLKASTTPGGHYLFTKEVLDAFALERGMIPPEPLRPDASEKYKILVIDDDEAFRSFTREALDTYTGYELREAEDGMQGALITGAWRPDMIIVDLRMPNMNGVEFCEFVKKDDSMAHTKLVVVSAYLAPEVREAVEILAVDAVLDKPVRLGRFVATIGKLADLEIG
ncbi:MAG: response regulator [Kiritimatiellaeota bacterium]|nr:response regulator [Kiritimatiellota bacterium]